MRKSDNSRIISVTMSDKDKNKDSEKKNLNFESEQTRKWLQDVLILMHLGLLVLEDSYNRPVNPVSLYTTLQNSI